MYKLLLLILIILIIYKNYKVQKYTNLIINKKPKIKLKFGSKYYFNNIKKERHHFQSIQQFVDYFLPSNYDYIIVDNEKSDITIWDIYLEDSSILRDDEINIIVCVENVPHWKYYQHYKNYDIYNDKKINIYLYNHIDSIVETNTYLSIPMIHYYINYYKNNYITLTPSEITPFENKKFCLMINKSNLNPDINNIVSILSNIGQIDNLGLYPDLIDKSCYHSVELLNVFNKYKFVICYENSYANGYITEKIFNCFFAKTLPIYKGSDMITSYINKNSFIDVRNSNFVNEITNIINNENLYNNYINCNKISEDYNDENYNYYIVSRINKLLT